MRDHEGNKQVTGVVAQLRTTDLPGSIHFYTTKLGLTLAFQYQDFYAGIRAGAQMIHLKRVDEPDPSIAFVTQGEHFHLYLETPNAQRAADALKRVGVSFVRELHDTPWGTREFVIADDQGHMLHFGETCRS